MQTDYSKRLSKPVSDFVGAAMPYSHWGINYFNIRLMELVLIDSLLDGAIKKGGERFLDFGCGLGLACVYASKYFSKVEGVDLDDPGVAFKTTRPAPAVGSELISGIGINNIQLTSGDSFAYLRDRTDRYDMLLSVFCLEHVEDIQGACDLFAASLKAGGRSVHIIPNTHDTTNQLLQTTLGPIAENEQNSVKSGRGTKKMGTMFAPITHSEFIEDYRQQFDVNCLERYIFPMMLSGMTIDKITPMREHSYAVLASKHGA
ncbi:methyltransferase domain-containing protein [Bradyrhizobium sp. AUGA SZCCT0176]|uniref:class I SAM-dependent methyltransferase n=1 Tax=Bradyrhizobium sp. AUGA SZCCT0176 TaxID=2807664 RepID=UPI001BA8ED8A|nr:methyltransferase domain-containing protein [Bradyrhizobium sp. AUGA SZCCT0176]MBR1230197.1 methyltransferase domain-containing protein [Bradyrhizobium sp. AUGA SZCCT0176]